MNPEILSKYSNQKIIKYFDETNKNSNEQRIKILKQISNNLNK